MIQLQINGKSKEGVVCSMSKFARLACVVCQHLAFIFLVRTAAVEWSINAPLSK